jgi:hypothetical protein
VYAYAVIAVPTDEAEYDAVPEAVVTVAGVAVLSVATSLTVEEAVNVTTVPVSAVAASATANPAEIVFVAGTATAKGAADVVVFAPPATVTARGAALDDVAISIVPVRAAAMTRLIFFNEFIFFPFLCFLY